MIELTEAHTAESLLTTIIEVLSLYGLTLKNVYSMTIDNARNMVKIPKLIGAAQCDVPVDNLLALIPEEEQVEEDEEDEEKEFSAEEMQRYKQHAERSLQLMNDLIRELSSAQPSQNLQTCETMRYYILTPIYIVMAYINLYIFYYFCSFFLYSSTT